MENKAGKGNQPELEKKLLELQKLHDEYRHLDFEKERDESNSELGEFIPALILITIFILPIGLLCWLGIIIYRIASKIKVKKNIIKPQNKLKKQFDTKLASFKKEYLTTCDKIKKMPFFSEICDKMIKKILTHTTYTETLSDEKKYVKYKEQEFMFFKSSVSLSTSGHTYSDIISFYKNQMEDLPDNVYLYAFTQTVINEVKNKLQNILSTEEYPNFNISVNSDIDWYKLNFDTEIDAFNTYYIEKIIEQGYYTCNFKLSYDGPTYNLTGW